MPRRIIIVNQSCRGFFQVPLILICLCRLADLVYLRAFWIIQIWVKTLKFKTYWGWINKEGCVEKPWCLISIDYKHHKSVELIGWVAFIDTSSISSRAYLSRLEAIYLVPSLSIYKSYLAIKRTMQKLETSLPRYSFYSIQLEFPSLILYILRLTPTSCIMSTTILYVNESRKYAAVPIWRSWQQKQ